MRCASRQVSQLQGLAHQETCWSKVPPAVHRLPLHLATDMVLASAISVPLHERLHPLL